MLNCVKSVTIIVSSTNVKRLGKMGIKHVGVAPTGKGEWSVSKKMESRIKRERAQVEGCIGTIKHSRYGFNRPDAKSTRAMVSYGHRAIMGFNMNKMTKLFTVK